LRAKLTEFAEMSESDLAPFQRPAWTSAIFILLTMFAGFVVIGPLIGFFVALPFIDGSMPDFVAQVGDPVSHPEVKTPLFIMQACATFFGLIVGPALYWFAIEKQNILTLLKKGTTPIAFLITGIIVISFMAVNSVFIEWNASFHFPEFLNDFEQWARARETYAEEITKFLTNFNSLGEFFFAFIIIALLPGIGEELVFRGLLQPQLHRATGNVHVAIWISAVLFSAIHMQFFGFIPRVLLGALFGYLYLWSGNLLVPMFAHFMNNGFSVLMLYLKQLGIIDIDIETTEAAPWPAVISFAIITFGLMVYLKKLFERNSSPA
jgi:membrane protease YdiL (CAAX protease family)